MPCNDGAAAVAKLLDSQVQLFESSVARTADEARSLLLRHGSESVDRVERLHKEIGDFGNLYIKSDGLNKLVPAARVQNRSVDRKIEKAIATFDELAKAECEFFVAQVPARGSLYETVRSALGRAGRAFGAARFVHAIRTGRRVQDQEQVLNSFPFDRWNASERKTAPPLIVELSGDDLRPASLGEFLDGTQKIVLVTRGACPPAPLARLISPGTFVVQCESPAGLESFAEYRGPGIAAIVPVDCALFVHDPTKGPNLRDRLTVRILPPARPRKPVAGLSGTQQQEELEILATFAQAPHEMPVTKSAESKEEDPVDKLAAWLLTQADLTETS